MAELLGRIDIEFFPCLFVNLGNQRFFPGLHVSMDFFPALRVRSNACLFHSGKDLHEWLLDFVIELFNAVLFEHVPSVLINGKEEEGNGCALGSEVLHFVSIDFRLLEKACQVRERVRRSCRIEEVGGNRRVKERNPFPWEIRFHDGLAVFRDDDFGFP